MDLATHKRTERNAARFLILSGFRSTPPPSPHLPSFKLGVDRGESHGMEKSERNFCSIKM